MNKQELIEEIKKHAIYHCGEKECYKEGCTQVVDLGLVLGLVKQLDEPQPVEVPLFVADWYEENKDDFEGNLYRCAHNIPSVFDSAKLNEFERWFLSAGTKQFQTLVNMHQFGYKVEKRYYVRFKWIEDSYSYLTLIKHLHAWTLKNITLDKKFRTAHTRKQLEEAGFGWVFDCPGIEIEEVE